MSSHYRSTNVAVGSSLCCGLQSFFHVVFEPAAQTDDWRPAPAAGWSGTWETRIRELAVWESQHEVRTDELNERLLSGFISSFRATEGSQLPSYEADEMLDTRTIWNKCFCTLKCCWWDSIQLSQLKATEEFSWQTPHIIHLSWLWDALCLFELLYKFDQMFICHKQPKVLHLESAQRLTLVPNRRLS